MITIRAAREEDTDAILELFRVCLGDEGGAPNREFWRWKHVENAFGPSPVLLGWEGTRLVGLRAFLRWRFGFRGKTFTGYRAVDTATHPSYRSRGIFTRLTLSLIEQLGAGEPALIFNTPNRKSMPGYLKMGWKKLGRTPLTFQVKPFNLVAGKLNPLPVLRASDWNHELLGRLVESWKVLNQGYICTDYNLDYLRWRYDRIPGFEYRLACSESKDGAIAMFYRIKESVIRELRITDLFIEGDKPKRLLAELIEKIAEEHRPGIITVLTDPKGCLASILPAGFFRLDRAGLIITLRYLNEPGLGQEAGDLNHWYFTSGCLELL